MYRRSLMIANRVMKQYTRNKQIGVFISIRQMNIDIKIWHSQVSQKYKTAKFKMMFRLRIQSLVHLYTQNSQFKIMVQQ